MEQRHDWAQMVFTPELFKYVFTQFLPEVIMHTKSQDEEQVRDHYDSMYMIRVIQCAVSDINLQEVTTSMNGWYP